jgi:hypothetical protein
METERSDGFKQEDITQWNGRNLQILLPVYRTVSPETHYTLFANYAKYGAEKIGLHMLSRTLIHEARNMLVDRFLKTDAEWCLFIDDDMVLPFGNAGAFAAKYGDAIPQKLAGVHAISRIMSWRSEYKIVGGLYYGRGKVGRAQCADGFRDDVSNIELHDVTKLGEIKESRWVATGFMRIHRSVFAAIKEKAAEEWPNILPSKEDRPVGYFTPEKVGVGEDVTFCLRAAHVGIKSYVDTGLVLLHTGECHYGPKNTLG